MNSSSINGNSKKSPSELLEIAVCKKFGAGIETVLNEFMFYDQEICERFYNLCRDEGYNAKITDNIIVTVIQS